MAQFASCQTIDKSHRDIAYRAIRNVLATEIALETFAQIIDGLPTIDVFLDSGFHLELDHPLRLHKETCLGTFDEAEKLRDSFDPSVLTFKSSLLEAFAATELSSKAFQLRLIELVAVAIHQIAVFLDRREHLHNPATTNGASVEEVADYGKYTRPMNWPEDRRWTTLFKIKLFDNVTQYPNGIHDIAGYWAENRIMGGVAVFNRCTDWSKLPDGEEPNAYFDSTRKLTTPLMCQLLDSQQHEIIRFLTLEDVKDASEDYTLPMVPGEVNVNRLSPDESVDYRVYRDIWEKPEPMIQTRRRRLNRRNGDSSHREWVPRGRRVRITAFPAINRNSTYDWPIFHSESERKAILREDEKNQQERRRKLKEQRAKRENSTNGVIDERMKDEETRKEETGAEREKVKEEGDEQLGSTALVNGCLTAEVTEVSDESGKSSAGK